MKVTFEFEGLKELQNRLETLASDSEIRKTNKQIFQRSVDYTEPRMKAVMARSADNSKSGKKGYRPSGHAADNIPTKATAKGGEVGWTLLGDAENWFYMKFVEWGTTKQPPQDFLYNTMEECRGQWDTIADQEYQKLLNEKLGG
jgi:HK97 gp10 family phage protein